MKMGGSSHRRRRRRSAPEAMAESTVASSTTTSKQIISKNRRDNSKSATNTHTHTNELMEMRRGADAALPDTRFDSPFLALVIANSWEFLSQKSFFFKMIIKTRK